MIGYDLLNEPWGDERRELAPLYRDAAEIIRAQHPGAIMFLEGHLTTNCGVATKLPRPSHGNVAYAPHYYRPLTIALSRWHGMTLGMNRAFSTMTATAQEWDAPLFLGEFGAAAETTNAGDYIAAIYDRMDANLASGAQWCYSPRWNERDKDGWNAEDFSILDSQGAVRPNFRPRPYPRNTAGTPLSFRFVDAQSSGGRPTLEFTWEHRPELGATEIFVPSSIFPPDALIEVSDRGMTCERDQSRQILVCRAAQRATVRVRISASPSRQLSGDPRARHGPGDADTMRVARVSITVRGDCPHAQPLSRNGPVPGKPGLVAGFSYVVLGRLSKGAQRRIAETLCGSYRGADHPG